METVIGTIIVLLLVAFIIYVLSVLREIFINAVYKKPLSVYEREKKEEKKARQEQEEKDRTLKNISSYQPTDIERICSELDFLINSRAYLDTTKLTQIQSEQLFKQRIASFLHRYPKDYRDIYVKNVRLCVGDANRTMISARYKAKNIDKNFSIQLKIDEKSSYSTYRINPLDYNRGDLIEVSGFFSSNYDYDDGLCISIDRINEIRIIEHNCNL